MIDPARPLPLGAIAGLAMIAVAAIVLVIFIGDGARDDASGITVVPGTASPERDEGIASLPTNGTVASAAVDDPSPQIIRALSQAFPLLAEVESRCDVQQCSVRALALEPPGGEALAAYEEMLRTGLASTLIRAGVRMNGPVQIEEAGGNRFRILIRATQA